MTGLELIAAGVALAFGLLFVLLAVGVPLLVFWVVLFKLVGRLRQAGGEDST